MKKVEKFFLDILIKIRRKLDSKIGILYWVGIILLIVLIAYLFLFAKLLDKNLANSKVSETSLTSSVASISSQLIAMKNEDQYLRNEKLEATISAIEETYDSASETYEDLLRLKDKTKVSKDLDNLFSEALAELSKRYYATAASVIEKLRGKIEDENEKLIASFVIPENLPAENTPPGSGYRRQRVVIDIGEYMVSIITADLNSTRVVVDTASDNTCANDCPVMSLASYVERSGAFAGINGSYFCPSTYPSCAGKTNSFDTLLMNKNKTYFNSDNNVYSTVPLVVFHGSSARFLGRSQDWGRDAGVDAVLANHPLLVSNGNVVFGGDGDPKKGSKGGRSFIGASGSTAYMGVVHNATVAESARVLQAMGVQNALNLDSGGSTALWVNGGYVAGPGRNLPNVLLFVRK
ncbi:phosphodiester glycosidase family protein [Patescibacteria group bacterium]